MNHPYLNRSALLLIPLLLALLISGCDTRSAYQKLEDEQLGSGVTNDSLFLGTHFGMRSADFYDHCFELNKKGLIKEGTGNTSVMYIPEGFEKEVRMLFYPKFNKETTGIETMPVLFYYASYSPWNKTYSPDSLLPEVLKMLTDWYGGEFLEVQHPEKGTVFVKLDGNRRIRVFVKDAQYVQATFEDLNQVDKDS